MEPFEHEKGVSYFPRGKRPSKCLAVLSVVSFVLLVISIVFITLYVLEKAKTTSTPQIPKEQKYCGSRACFDAAKGKLKCISCKHSRTFTEYLDNKQSWFFSLEIYFRFKLFNTVYAKWELNFNNFTEENGHQAVAVYRKKPKFLHSRFVDQV